MDWEKENKIIKMIDRVAEEVQMIGQTLDEIEGIETSARNARLELLNIIQLFKLNNEEKEKKNGEKEIIQHKKEGQEIRS